MERQIRSKDTDIRQDLVAWLSALHPDDTNIRICHEFKIRSRGARADIVLLNGELAGFEIKSDADTVARLPHQISAFSAVLDKISVVTTQKNLPKVKAIVPEWCGILLYSTQGATKFSVIDQALPCPPQNKHELASLLSIGELRLALKTNGNGKGLSKANAAEMIEAFVTRLTDDEQKSALLSALKSRVDFDADIRALICHSPS